MTLPDGGTGAIRPAEPSRTALIAALGLGLVGAVVIRVLLMPSYVLLGDLDQYARWAHHLATEPFGSAYSQDFSYMPVLVAVFGALGALVPGFATASDASDAGIRIILKVPALAGEIAIVAGLLVLTRGRPAFTVAAILGILLVPASWYLGAWWAQLDAVWVALCLWAAILASRDRPWLFAVVLGLAMMTKPQALFLAFPFAGYAIGRWGIRRAALVGVVAAGVAAATWLPFVPYGGPADYLRNLDYYQNGEYPFLSTRAWNPWWILQTMIGGESFVTDSTPLLGPFTPRHLGMAMTAIAELAVLVTLARRATPERLLLGLGAATLAAFCLMTSMHERYAFAALVFLAPLLDRRPILIAWGVLAATISLNVVAGAPPDPTGPLLPVGGLLGIVGSLAMTVTTVIVLAALFRERGAAGEGAWRRAAGEDPDAVSGGRPAAA